LKVLLNMPYSVYSGYGNDSIGITRSLMKMGADVYIQPTYTAPPLPKDIAMLLTKPLDGPFDLSITHVDPMQIDMDGIQRRVTDYAVAWSMWEYSSLDNLRGRSNLRKKLKKFDAFIGYDAVTLDGFKPYLSKTTASTVLQGGFWPEDWNYVERDWYSDRFGFCMVGQLHDRKDPFVSIQAFQQLKENYPKDFDGAELHLKTNIPGLHKAMEEWCPKLRIHAGTWPVSTLKKFYETQHVLLAPSRGEGKNMPALEFQSTGGAVIATNWGGMANWLSPSYAYPLDYALVPITPQLPNCKQARASLDQMKELLMHTYKNRTEVKEKAYQASQVIPQMCSWDSVVEKFFLKLAKADPEKGGKLLMKAKMCQGASNG
jgi:glycosyltransferase involved in cell wall biosynthesis